MAELVDARDLKSLGPRGCTGSSPVPGTKNKDSGFINLSPFSYFENDVSMFS